jgi:hypothetical protein
MTSYQAGRCGEYCGKCSHYGIACMGCTYKLHTDCYFAICCAEREIEHCGECPSFPCQRLAKFAPDSRPGNVRGEHLTNLRARLRLGTEEWLKIQRERYGN